MTDAGTPADAAAATTAGDSGESWSILRLVRWSADYLEEKGVPASQARLDAEHLLAHTLGSTRLQLYLQHDRPLTPEELAAFKPLLLRRAKREPLQYILGRGAFRELDLRVDPRVLIPRPETEELVEAVLEWARERTGTERNRSRAGRSGPLPWNAESGTGAEADDSVAAPTEDETHDGAGGAGTDEAAADDASTDEASAAAGPPPDVRTLTALDVGAGSGCIALSLALEGPFGRIVATDVSEEALELLGENAREAGLAERVEARAGDLYAPVAGETFDVVVSNPPYVARRDAGELEPEVREHEPAGALFGGDDGTEVLRPLVAGAAAHLRPGGLLALEVGLGQADEVADGIRATGAFDEPRIVRDLAKRPRMVLAERKSHG